MTWFTVRVQYGSGGPGRLGYLTRNWHLARDWPELHARPPTGAEAFDSLEISSAVGLLPLTDPDGCPLTEILIRKVGRFDADGKVHTTGE